MSHYYRSILVLTLALLLCPAIVSAQQTNDEQKAAEAALREKAFKLLESLAGEISTLQSAENRVRIGYNIAASLWNHDEQRARAVLAHVEDDIKVALQAPESNDARDIHTHSVFLKLRLDSAERIGRHDPEAALAYLKATRPAWETPVYRNAGSEQALELQLANAAAAKNPELAFNLGRESLKRGFSVKLLNVLKELNRKHKDLARTLYNEIVTELRKKDFTRDWQISDFALALAHSFPPPDADASAFRDLIGMFIKTAIDRGCLSESEEEREEWYCRRLGTLVPHMERIDPTRGAQLRRWAPQTQSGQRPAYGYIELNSLDEDASIEDVLSLTTKYPEIESAIRWQAMRKATSSGDFELARKIADAMTDEQVRLRARAELERQQKWHSANEEEYAELQKTLATIPQVMKRIEILVAVSSQLGATDRKMALRVLDQASGIIDTMKPGREQTQAQIVLAMMYCLEKNERGFTIVESLIPKFNELVAAGMKLDGFDNRYVRDGEWSMTAEGNVGDLLTLLAFNANFFAWCNFDRAVSSTSQFERPEIRMMAQLKLAQGILSGPPSRHRLGAASRY